MDKLSFMSSQAASPVPNLPSLSKTNYNQRFPGKSSIIKSQVDCKSSNINLSTFSSNELTPINPLQSQSTINDPMQSKAVKSPMQKWPQKEVKGWNPLHNMLAAALDMVEKGFIQDLEKRDPLPDTANPEVQLAGNFFPVPENAVQHDLEIEGKLPEGLEGVYVRNGANPKYRPLAGHHLFDGDGMLHAVRIQQGIASYANRFTKTHRFLEEERIGRPIFPKAIGELHGHSGIARLLLFYARACFGVINGNQGMGVANAGVIFFNGQLLAMSEDDLPYAIHITSNGDLQTIGKYDFNGQLKTSMIAHPKVDLESGELFALSYDVIKKPYLRYFKINKDGKKELEVNIDGVNEPTMMHDFAITQHFVIIPDQQVTFQLQQMLRGGSPVNYNQEKTSRFGVLPRGAIDDREMKWIDVPDCFCFHLWNAWEEDGDEVVVIGSCMTPPDSIFNESKDSLQSVLTEIRLNLSTLNSHRRVICPSLNLEAGQVNRKYLGKKTQYAYLAIAQPWPKVCGVAKINLLAHSHTYPNTNIPHTQLSLDDKHMPTTVANSSHSCGIHSIHSGIATNPSHIPTNSHCISSHLPITNNNTHDHNTYVHHKKNRANANPTPNDDNVVASFMYPPNCFGGEPMFVPRSLDPSTPEDDGYVLTFMHNEETCKSELLILDASSPSLDMLASIKIPSRVPYGFHGTFITSQELEHQKPNQI